jgi:hypothetical protein
LLSARGIIDIRKLMREMPRMRTTITINDELMDQVESMRLREGLTQRAAIERLIRVGLAHVDGLPAPREDTTPSRRLGLRSGIDPTRTNQLTDEIEAPGSRHPYKYRRAYVVDGTCGVRFDNEAGKGDHVHVGSSERLYRFSTPDQLLTDFQKEISRWNDENGHP